MVREYKKKYGENSIIFFPRFNSRDELKNHYYRACWYLPRLKGKCDFVYMFQTVEKGIDIGERPLYMCEFSSDKSHIHLKTGFFSYLKALLRSRLILVHKNYRPSSLLQKQKIFKLIYHAEE